MFKRNVWSKLFFQSAILIGFFVSVSFSASKPYLIECNFDNTTPALINSNIAKYEALPFDGNLLRVGASWGILTNNSQSYNTMYNEILPLKGKYSKLPNCWLFVGLNAPGDWFDNWATCIQNFANAAKVCKDLGMEGIMMDPEGGYDTWDYSKQALASSKSEAEYKTQAILQGKAIMTAMVKEFSTIKILTLHGPYISDPNTPSSVRRNQYGNYPMNNRLLGAFFTGWVEGSGATGVPVDGGEVYQYRTLKDFQDSYTWRKYTIASATNNNPSIPVADRAIWPTTINISFGLYPYSWPSATADVMTPTIMRTCAEYALKTCDSHVWWYDDGVMTTALRDEYMAVLKAACDVAKTGIEFTSVENVSAATGSNFGYKIKYDNRTGTSATISYLKKPSWITSGLDTLYGKAPDVIGNDTLKAVVSAGGKSDTLNLKISVSAYYSFEAEDCAIISSFQVLSDVTASGGKCITAPVGSGKTISAKEEATHGLNLAQAGNYYLWALISSVTGNNDVGTFTGFNGKFDSFGLKTAASGAYEWVRSNKIYALTAGNNYVNIGHANEQVRIDKILVTSSPDLKLPNNVGIKQKNINIKTSALNLSVNKTQLKNLEFNVLLVNNGKFNLKLLNVAGQKIWETNSIGSKGSNFIKSNAKINNGLYVVALEQNNEKLVKKIMIIK